MRQTFLLFILSASLLSCNGENTTDENSVDAELSTENADTNSSSIETPPVGTDEDVPPPVMETVTPEQAVTFETFQNDDASWGYKIYLDGKLYVNQPHVPAVQGKSGFKSREDAEQTAILVSDKVKNGISPPTVSKDELKELGVID